jgi:hypothetical protein
VSDQYEYKVINLSNEPSRNLETACNRWAAMGWRVVSVMQATHADRKAGFATSFLVERVKNDKKWLAFTGGKVPK